MFIGRKEELELLENLYCSDQFEFLILYGRRRVGKTALLQEFAADHKCLFYSGKEKNEILNRKDFAKALSNYCEEEYLSNVADWNAMFSYFGDWRQEKKKVLIIDEFPFIAEENPTVKSILQHVIDQSWSRQNLLLILCGSSISFMENEVMGYKSPLYGRITTQLFLQPFDYYESAEFFPAYSAVDKLISYGILGGIPRYLQMFSDQKPVRENIKTQILGKGSFLKEEPQNLLKMELRNPIVYNGILESIATGASKLNEISGKLHEDSGKCSKYIDTLRKLHIVEKFVPCGEKETSKKSIYRITDHYFMFWYYYLFENLDYYEMLGEEQAADEIAADISAYMGAVFENICTQYLKRKAKAGLLPFVPYRIGRWWGTDSRSRKQRDIDILCLDKRGQSAIFCECKFRNERFDLAEYRDFMSATECISEPVRRYYYIFIKSGYTEAVLRQAQEDRVQLLCAEDLFDF